MISGVRFRARPSRQLQAILRVWIGHQRFIVNSKVRERRERHNAGLEPDKSQKYAHLVTEDSEFLRDVPSQLLRNGVYRYFNSLKRFEAGLGGPPKKRNRHGRQSVLITKELFRFNPVPGKPLSKQHGWVLELGTQAKPIGEMGFIAHRDWEIPNQISISVEPSGEWFVSFSYEELKLENVEEEPFIERSPEELLYELQNRKDLASVVWAGDLGVAIPLVDSDGVCHDLSDVQKARLAKAERNKRRYQRRMARCAKVKVTEGGKTRTRVSRNYLKLKRKAARQSAYMANVREDFAHQVSHKLVSSDHQVFAFEDLNIKNMTAAPAPKQDAAGRWAPNGSAAKAGLNASILRSAWGRVRRFTEYKARKRNKLVLLLNPAYSSQTCSACGVVHAHSRKSQSEFACVACGHTANADVNAAQVLKSRALEKIAAGKKPAAKKVKRVAFVRKRKQALEQELLEVTSESGVRKPSSAAKTADEAVLRCTA